MQFGLRTLLFVVLLLGMLVLSYPLLFKKLNLQRDDALADTRQKREKLEALAGAMKDNASMSTEIDKLRTAISFLESKLPKETEMDRVLQDVWKAAKDNNLNIKSVRNAKPVESGSYSQQPIRMVVEGPFYPSFFKFLFSRTLYCGRGAGRGNSFVVQGSTSQGIFAEATIFFAKSNQVHIPSLVA